MTARDAAQPVSSISQYWHTRAVPDYLVEPLATFRGLNPDLEQRVFSEAGAERFIAEHFGRRELDAFRACAVPSMQSDYIRYCAVLALGGVYADVDYRCKAPLRPLVEGCDGGEIFLGPSLHDLNGHSTRRIWSGLFAFRRPGHEFLRLALEIATANIEARIPERVWPVGQNVREGVWLTVGPGVFTLMRFIREWGSLDAFLANIAGSPVEPFGDLYCEVIGEYDRLLEAFEGVRVSPHERIWDWVEDVPWSELPYKETDLHWHNFKSAIFR